MTSVAERHYRVQELAQLWRLSRQTIAQLFKDEPGVIKIGKGLGRYRRKRPHLTLIIPESVAMRVKTRLASSGK
jgi:hypothetical protein